MAEEQGKGIQQIEGCEVIYDMGSGLVIAKVPLDKVKEQAVPCLEFIVLRFPELFCFGVCFP